MEENFKNFKNFFFGIDNNQPFMYNCFYVVIKRVFS